MENKVFKVIGLADIVPGRLYSWVYDADEIAVAKGMNKGGTRGTTPNPFYGQVSKRAVYAGQAATAEMYARAWEKENPGQTYTPDPDYTARFAATDNPCVVRSLATGDLQVRILRPATRKTEYFIAKQPASPEQVATIEAYKTARKERSGAVKIMFPYVHNLFNVD